MRSIVYLFVAQIFASVDASSQTIDQLISPGELSGAHAKFSGIGNCNVCHGKDSKIIESKCLDCHKPLASRIAEKKGFHANKSTGCTGCHSDHLGKDFDIRQLDQATFNHDETGYKLEGLHKAVKDCARCHKTRSFLGLSARCQPCHADRHVGRLPACESCHSVDRPMKQVVYDHSAAHYRLEGAHATTPCAACHKNEVYTGLQFANCTPCHADVHRGTLGADCTRCHTAERWKGVNVKHVAFPLRGKHITVECAKCHPGGKWKLVAFARCSDCHRDPHLGQFRQPCEDCHTDAGFKPAKFNHDAFRLEQKHAIECAKCHKLEKARYPAGAGEAVRYLPLSTDCVSCHKDIHAGQVGTRCETCHGIASFKVGAFDHSRTRYPLDKDHIKVPCEKCHKRDAGTGIVHYKPIAVGCSPCHADVHLGQLGKDCDRCHNPKGLQFKHATTSYPLEGKHSTVACEKCHKKEKGRFAAGEGEAVRYKPISRLCAACHADYHRGQFKEDCGKCHVPASYKPTTFSHASSDFPLAGKHAALECGKCHKVEVFATPPPPVSLTRYRPLARECSGCHRDPHSGIFGAGCGLCHNVQEWRNVDSSFHRSTSFALTGRHLTVPCASCHIASGVTPTACEACHWQRRKDDPFEGRLGLICAQCHSTTAWAPARFDHAEVTGFGLVAEHAGIACRDCHHGGMGPAPRTCAGCHLKDYESAMEPPHSTLAFSTECTDCHHAGDGSWSAGRYNHRQYRPVGRHKTAPCAACHAGGRYTGLSLDCYSCHQSAYEQTTNPDHLRAGFSKDCLLCHHASDATWNQGVFDHSSTRFPLQGAHTNLPCSACHKAGMYSGLSPDCYSCHKSQYDATTDPNHAQAGYPTDCIVCHKATDKRWEQGRFDHANTGFPLRGAHTHLSCQRCHKGGIYTGLSPDCYSCHKAQYDATTNPNHQQAGFPTNCIICHKATDLRWEQGQFDHANTGFALQGAHTHLPCETCHKGGIYIGLSPVCYSCHKAQYDATTDPNHKKAGFPTDCVMCHKATDARWDQGKFDHAGTGFALQGAHTRLNCARCHKGGVYTGLSSLCYSCHKADYDATTNPNHKAAGFPTDCILCHKATDTRWDQGVFDHGATGFPLQGAHTPLACENCHQGGVYTGLSPICYSCHKAQYDATTNPNHKATGFPTDCIACHFPTDTSWNQGRFDHPFPIKGPHNVPCTSCHNSPSNYAVFDCLTCHPLGSIKEDHNEVNGFVYTSEACYRCHPNGTGGDRLLW